MNCGLISVFLDDGSVFQIDASSDSPGFFYVYHWYSDGRCFFVYFSSSLDACYSFIYRFLWI